MESFWTPPHWFRRLWVDVDKTVKRGFHVDPFTITVLLAFGCSLLLFMILMPLICCCARRKKSQRNAREKSSEPIKRRFPLTVARFEEFETLSPLIVSPNSSTPSSFRQKREADQIRASRELFLRQHNIRPQDESPPPPRRFNGRTVIVPLASNSTRACRPLIAPLLGTPDSRITTFEMGTKSCATIPEDDELELDLDEDEHNHTIIRHLEDDEITTEGDLVSIDRTYISARESRCFVPKYRQFIGNYVPSPVPMPDFQLAPPTYTPPAPPKPTDTVHSTPIKQRQSRHDTNTQGQSNLSSPEMSSCGFDSMIEETAESDFMIAIDETGNDEKIIIDFGKDDPNEFTQHQLKNLQLQRIEEESDEASSISRFLYSSSAGSSLSKFNNTNLKMPRSISQQLDFMMNNHAH